MVIWVKKTMSLGSLASSSMSWRKRSARMASEFESTLAWLCCSRARRRSVRVTG